MNVWAINYPQKLHDTSGIYILLTQASPYWRFFVSYTLALMASTLPPTFSVINITNCNQNPTAVNIFLSACLWLFSLYKSCCSAHWQECEFCLFHAKRRRHTNRQNYDCLLLKTSQHQAPRNTTARRKMPSEKKICQMRCAWILHKLYWSITAWRT